MEFVDFGYIANAARINLIALANLALAPAKPKNVTIVTGKLTNDTELRWDAPSDEIVGYEVVWRTTTAPFWSQLFRRFPSLLRSRHYLTFSKELPEPPQDAAVAAPITPYTLKEMSKDNYFFGVRAFDHRGHKSPVVYPRPGR